eukprot:m.121073 g.121073  ORF g.121073 m.121073 type:complete len:252 (+) comp13700_c0_seq7:722-1477(+)
MHLRLMSQLSSRFVLPTYVLMSFFFVLPRAPLNHFHTLNTICSSDHTLTCCLSLQLMPNVHIGKQKIESRFAKVNPLDGSCEVIHYDSTEFGLLGNFLATEGVSGQVIKVEVSHRTGDKNFVTCMREGLGAHYDDKPVGIGGVFLIEKGSAKYHVMPDFSKIPLESDAAVDGWLKFYHTSAPFTCLSTFISHDPGLDLRVDHTHGFNLKGDGGHYHYDVTPTDVKYTGYFVVAEQIFRIDPPTKTHQIGRD